YQPGKKFYYLFIDFSILKRYSIFMWKKISLFVIIQFCISSVLFADEVLPVNNRDFLSTVEREIALVRENISIVHYSFYSKGAPSKIIKLLKRASKRNINVQILLDDNSKYSKAFQKKYSADFQIKLDSPERTTHCKLIIFDNNKTLLGSTNLSNNSMVNNNETNVLIYSKTIADYFNSYFKTLWRNSEDSVSIEKKDTENIIPLSDRDIFPSILELIEKAKQKLYISMYAVKINENFSDSKIKRLLDKIAKARERGVDVKFLIEKSNFEEFLTEMNKQSLNYLKSKGVPVRFDDPETITHAKLLISDNAVLIGSANWGYGALELYHETGVIIKIPEITQSFYKYFENLWEAPYTQQD
ncbi:MAG: phospholipase D-like domain-containing protein, partial [Candidatus Auribacterota bacterium]|nr:phospholipase D-like domain-containing protein [Candidatus Auribacterota bacterium]